MKKRYRVPGTRYSNANSLFVPAAASCDNRYSLLEQDENNRKCRKF